MTCLKDMEMYEYFDTEVYAFEDGKVSKIKVCNNMFIGIAVLLKCKMDKDLVVSYMFTTREEAEAKLKELNNE